MYFSSVGPSYSPSDRSSYTSFSSPRNSELSLDSDAFPLYSFPVYGFSHPDDCIQQCTETNSGLNIGNGAYGANFAHSTSVGIEMLPRLDGFNHLPFAAPFPMSSDSFEPVGTINPSVLCSVVETGEHLHNLDARHPCHNELFLCDDLSNTQSSTKSSVLPTFDQGLFEDERGSYSIQMSNGSTRRIRQSDESHRESRKHSRGNPPPRSAQYTAVQVRNALEVVRKEKPSHCPLCSHRPRSTRLADFERHVMTHDHMSQTVRYVCYGEPEYDADGVPTGNRLNACFKTFSRRDALKRHLSPRSKEKRECKGDIDENLAYIKSLVC